MRVKFNKGKQREFLEKVLKKVDSPSLRELSNRVQVKYSTLKNYYNESRNLPKDLFEDLCFLAKISPKDFKVEILSDNFGQVKGGKLGKRIK